MSNEYPTTGTGNLDQMPILPPVLTDEQTAAFVTAVNKAAQSGQIGEEIVQAMKAIAPFVSQIISLAKLAGIH